jgi:ABC-type Fe3+ transport system permease subunit
LRTFLATLGLALPWALLVAATLGSPHEVGRSIELAFGSRTISAALGSTQVAAWAGLGALLLGGLAALGLRARATAARLVLVATPILLPLYVLAVGWDGALDLLPGGALRETCERLLHSPAGTGFVHAAWGFPVVALALAAGMRARDPERAESARLLAGGAGRVRLALRELAPAAIAATMVVMALSLVEPLVPHLYRLADPELDVLAGEVLTQLGIHRDARAAALACAPLALISILLMLTALGLTRRMQLRPQSASARAAAPPPAPGSRTRSLIPAGVLLLALGPPLLALVITALDSPAGAAGALRDHVAVTIRSLLVAAAAAALAAPLAVAIALELCAARTSALRTSLLIALLFTPAMLPSGVPALGLLRLCNRPALDWIRDGSGIVVLAQALTALPYVALLSWAALARRPLASEEEARLLGASSAAVFFRVTLPGARWGLAAACGLGMLLSFSEVQATSISLPPGLTLLSTRVLDLAHYGTSFDLASLALVLAAAPLLFALLAAGLARRRSPRAPRPPTGDRPG